MSPALASLEDAEGAFAKAASDLTAARRRQADKLKRELAAATKRKNDLQATLEHNARVAAAQEAAMLKEVQDLDPTFTGVVSAPATPTVTATSTAPVAAKATAPAPEPTAPTVAVTEPEPQESVGLPKAKVVPAKTSAKEAVVKAGTMVKNNSKYGKRIVYALLGALAGYIVAYFVSFAVAGLPAFEPIMPFIWIILVIGGGAFGYSRAVPRAEKVPTHP
jgi:hypothetical protein